MEPQWHKLLADNGELNRTFWLKSRVGTALEALQESFPSYTEKDFVVCHRMNEKGLWLDEIWTKRAFSAHEILFAPLVSQMKETHLTLSANVVLGMPKHGRGAPGSSMSLALDGRGSFSFAKAGSLDGQDHTGNLSFGWSGEPLRAPRSKGT